MRALSTRLIRSPTPTRIVLQGQELLTSNMMVRPRRAAFLPWEKKWLSKLASSHVVFLSFPGLPDGRPEGRCSVVESPSELVGW